MECSDFMSGGVCFVVKMGNLAMDTLALLGRGLLWRTFMRLGLMVLMERLLVCLECLMV